MKNKIPIKQYRRIMKQCVMSIVLAFLASVVLSMPAHGTDKKNDPHGKLAAKYEKQHKELTDKPTITGYDKLIQWCKLNKMSVEADALRQEKALLEYPGRKAKVKTKDVKALGDLAKWCEKNGLEEQAEESWNAVIDCDPDNAEARIGLGFAKLDGQWISSLEISKRYVALEPDQRKDFFNTIKKAGFKGTNADLDVYVSWVKAPTGLLKDQRVPDREEKDAWYIASVPANYDTFGEPLPLVIVLHGGDANDGDANMMLGFTSSASAAFKNCIVILPNHIRGRWSWIGAFEMTYLLDTIGDVMHRWRVDQRRIYLTGYSMGGNGVWGFGTQCHELFAAMAPMAGFWITKFNFPMATLIPKPVCILHGTKDPTVPVQGARDALALLKSLGASNVELRECTESGHVVPEAEMEKVREWLLQFRNKEKFDIDKLRKRVATVKFGWGNID